MVFRAEVFFLCNILQKGVSEVPVYDKRKELVEKGINLKLKC